MLRRHFLTEELANVIQVHTLRLGHANRRVQNAKHEADRIEEECTVGFEDILLLWDNIGDDKIGSPLGKRRRRQRLLLHVHGEDFTGIDPRNAAPSDRKEGNVEADTDQHTPTKNCLRAGVDVENSNQQRKHACPTDEYCHPHCAYQQECAPPPLVDDHHHDESKDKIRDVYYKRSDKTVDRNTSIKENLRPIAEDRVDTGELLQELQHVRDDHASSNGPVLPQLAPGSLVRIAPHSLSQACKFQLCGFL
mmetsp:Transcript_60643/g.161144  ORF Transcript_60643/g.161144 Transcript_60643/m.161144 type:complete len:250 (-) Transcript_60643:744-1493(-)